MAKLTLNKVAEALTKAGAQPANSLNRHSWSFRFPDGRRVDFSNVELFVVCRDGERDEPETDYFCGASFDTLAAALECATSLYHTWRKGGVGPGLDPYDHTELNASVFVTTAGKKACRVAVRLHGKRTRSGKDHFITRAVGGPLTAAAEAFVAGDMPGEALFDFVLDAVPKFAAAAGAI